MAAETETEKIVRAAVVTGSSRGIGRAIAEKLAGAGYNVCVNCSSESGLEAVSALADELPLAAHQGASGHRARGSPTWRPERRQAGPIEAAFGEFGRIDVLVNNAGITRDGLIARMKDEDFDAVIDVNLKGTFNCCRPAAQRMMKQRYGRIVNMSSVVGVAGNAGRPTTPLPSGHHQADQVHRPRAGRPQHHVQRRRSRMNDERPPTRFQQRGTGERIAAKRFGTAEEVAALVRFLASEGSGYITGQVICIDGGMSL